MAINLNHYYVIFPNDNLKTLIYQHMDNTNDNTPLVLVGQPLLWKREISLPPNPEMKDMDLKLVFLGSLIHEYGDSDNASFRNFIHELLGKPPYAVDIFEKWWVLHAFELGEQIFESYMADIDKSIFNNFLKSSNIIFNIWLDSLCSEKK